MFKNLTTTLLLTSIFFYAGCSKDDSQDATKTSKSTSKEIVTSEDEYVLKGLDSKEYIVKKEKTGFSLKGAEGKVVIFDIFATWCPPCRVAAPHLSALQEKYKDDIIIIGITIEDKISNSKLFDFRNEFNAQYTLVNSEQNLPLVYSIADQLKLGDNFPIPVMALYKDGKYIDHYVGSVEEEFVENDIKLALEK